MKHLLGSLMLATMAPCAIAGPVGGFINGGFSSATAKVEDSAGSSIDIDRGRGFNLTGGLRIHPSMMLRLGYDTTNHDSISGCIAGAGCGSASNQDLDINETRAGFFYAPPQTGTVGFLVGVGYEKVALENQRSGSDADADGVFVEGALLLNAGRVATFTIGAAALVLKNDDDEDTTGGEGKVGVTFHAGPVDLGLVARRVALTTDFDGGGSEDDTVDEFQLTIGGAWGYPD